MKKIFVLMLALTLAIPAISFAGSATSRWDLTIGGNVKFDAIYTDVEAGALNQTSLPPRHSQPGYDNQVNKYGNYSWGSGETGLNFAVRGPDALGAKTSAFISGDFVGVWGGSSYGTFDLMNANFTLDWGQTALIIGQQGTQWGMLSTFALDPNWGNMSYGGKAIPPVAPGITFVQKFGKNFKATFEVGSNAAPQASVDSSGAAQNNLTIGPVPTFSGGVVYSSDACGKVGPYSLLIGVGGEFAEEKQVYQTSTGTQPLALTDTNVNMWGADIRALVPIIPEKNGNKTNALYFDVDVYTGQNLNNYYGGTPTAFGANVYARPGSGVNTNYGSPVMTGYVIHGQYYFIDQLSINGFYWNAYIRGSNWWASNIQQVAATNTSSGVVKSANYYSANLMWDLNPAIRMVLQYDQMKANYAANNAVAGFENYGQRRSLHLAGYYYF